MIVLITGGQRSGKSSFAEKLLAGIDDVVYFATAEKREDDCEMNKRIQKHVARRNKNWQTIECYKNFSEHIASHKNYMLDCVTNSVSCFMFEYTGTLEHITDADFAKVLAAIQNDFSDLIKTVRNKNARLLLVTNEVGSATIPINKVARMFVDLQGMTNSFLATQSDEVYLCVSGIPVKIK